MLQEAVHIVTTGLESNNVKRVNFSKAWATRYLETHINEWLDIRYGVR